MRKQLLLALLMFLPMMVSAEEVEIDGLWYNLVSKVKTAEVIQYKNDEKYSGDVIIPSTIYHEEVEYEVKSIGVNAFYFCEDLTSISIPNSITNIGNQSFLGCSKLTSVIIPNGVSSINSFTFSNCKSLTSITIPNSVTTIDDNAFSGCI